ncbi:hypothetical protein EOPP23_10255 [Endozoicomonas sp. OPT23]|uniref:YiiX/YebB-like N1pC/P60 family cysteine hydrolase n=1 Tax=Endozoicomonas sp. OPT23 TaxID=2072845 RepID=UPI00129B3459|nr:YiiX/YebB-like N1pC/P60 family cysteine hydrolase [Endozoicomonas sp. OPT23]MRI33366.1 hypothetical protein [Endozoicomonas sp. OPT23]
MLTGLQKGDLLFQFRTGGELEWIISRLFAGYNGMAINHVAIYSGENEVIEAIMPRVQKTTLDYFISRSVVDGLDRPCILHARVKPRYSALAEGAVAFADQQLQLPYNIDYSAKSRSWYCSALILEAFRYANGNIPVFPETPMGFRDLETGELFPYWVELYKTIGQSIPEGEPGSHPALLSCSDKLEVVGLLGQLPVRQNSWTNLDKGMQLA